MLLTLVNESMPALDQTCLRPLRETNLGYVAIDSAKGLASSAGGFPRVFATIGAVKAATPIGTQVVSVNMQELLALLVAFPSLHMDVVAYLRFYATLSEMALVMGKPKTILNGLPVPAPGRTFMVLDRSAWMAQQSGGSHVLSLVADLGVGSGSSVVSNDVDVHESAPAPTAPVAAACAAVSGAGGERSVDARDVQPCPA